MNRPQPIEFFLNVDSLIKLGSDGYPEYHEGSGMELSILDRTAARVIQRLARRDDLTPHEVSVLRLARTDTAWLAAMKKRDRDPALAQARFQAKAELIEPNV